MAEAICLMRVATDGRIVSVNDVWDTFALENDGDHLVSAHVCGSMLNDHISDAETQHIYDLIAEAVRKSGRPMRFPFRCDSPRLRRFMEMEVRPTDDGFDYVSRTVRVEEREPQPLLDPAVERLEQLLRMCSWCKKVLADAEWLEVEEAVRRLDLFGKYPLPRITHSICAPCKENYMSRLQKHRRKA